MPTPRVVISLDKITHNARALKAQFGSRGVDVIGVTKVVCGDPAVAAALVDGGLSTLADSRVANIRRMRDAGIRARFLLLRTPFPSQTEDVVKYTDMSVNSELSVIKQLSTVARASKTTHKIALMVELGDLREGIMPRDLEGAVAQIIKLDGIELAGIGTNLACFGGIAPDDENMSQLSSIVRMLEERFELNFEFVSGGNSANYSWLGSASDIGRINNVRLGESIFLGCETLRREPIPDLFLDAFTLVVEVIESKINPSVPYVADVCQDAFGKVPRFQDLGEMRRAILGVGLQDVQPSGLTPRPPIDVIGASSDHIIVNAGRLSLEVGDEVEFDLDYGALLPAMTSPYVTKIYN